MASHYQAATLIASPSYPNAVAWSSENLVAVASGHLVTILNPAELDGPRGLVVLRHSDPFPIGVVNREAGEAGPNSKGVHPKDDYGSKRCNNDLFEPCLVPTSLSRDTQPCARSVSWSQHGFAPNSGCLLAICTVDGRVKLYRSPFCEFCDEWVEVADISQLLYNYYKNINFGEDDGPHSFTQRDANTEPTQDLRCVPELQEPEQTQDFGCVLELQGSEQTHDLGSVPELQEPEQTLVLGCVRELQEPICFRGPGKRKRKATRVEGYIYDGNEDGLEVSKDADFSLKPCSKSKKRSLKKAVKPGPEVVLVNGQGRSQNIKGPLSCDRENRSSSLITAKQYACRDALLSSLVVAWSPVVSSHDSTSFCSRDWCILAVGSKSGNVSLWKIWKPEYYTIDVGMVTRDPMLIGVLQAHKSWVSSISWEISSMGSSNPLLLLATGCLDGSVKVWSGSIEGLNECNGAKEVPFALVAEVTTDSADPVSSISLSVPAQPQHEVNLAVGRVSGSVETCIFNLCSNRTENTNACYAHDQVVYHGVWIAIVYIAAVRDNSMLCWIFHRDHLEEIPVHTHFPELKESTDLSEVSDRCFGLALAPGELMIAVVRSLDLTLLNQMYQVRTQNSVVEFIWIGGQSLGIPLDKSIHECSLRSVILSASNFLWWGSNILWSLKKYENGGRALVLWDVIAALQGFKKYEPKFLETLMHNWISDLFPDDPECVSINAPPHSRRDMMSHVSLRKLHLLNIICRKVMLRDHAQYSPGAEKGNPATSDLWNDLLASSERELRERLVAFTFASVLKRTSYLLRGASIENSWFPVGVAQMDAWLSFNDGEVHNQLKFLRSRIKDLGSRIESFCEYSVEETCSYCSGPVHFNSPDVAICSGSNPGTAPADRHNLSRCRASMRLCSVLQPVWHCVCCTGTVDKLLPETFFTMQASPLDAAAAATDDESLDQSAAAVPLCPFCGILLQRSVPVFLLSPSPV
ncbi:hypothetical protein ACP70R_011472 [Stipagrostis hirtigluma subsp. patula]